MPYLYAVQMVIPEYPNPVKIGYSKERDKRATSYTSSPFPIRVIGTWPVESQIDEAAVHARFDQYRLNGEWFYPAHYVLAYINAQIDRRGGVRPTCPVVAGNYVGPERYQRWRLAKIAAITQGRKHPWGSLLTADEFLSSTFDQSEVSHAALSSAWRI